MIDQIDGLSSLISGPAGFFVGVLSGVLANFAGNLIWRRYKKPSLGFEPTGAARFQVDDTGSVNGRVFRVLVNNSGKEAALNCKPKLNLEGELEGDIYEIETSLTWAESNDPSRITINQDETATFNLFTMYSEQAGQTVSYGLQFFIEFPNEMADEDPNIVRWEYNDQNQLSGADFLNRLDKEDFTDMNWINRTIKVTSENAPAVEAEFSLDEDVEDARGLVGMRLNISET